MRSQLLLFGLLSPAIVLYSQLAPAPARLGHAVSSQTPTQTPTAIPDSVLYEMMFRRIADQTKIIAKIDSLGKDSTHARSDLQNQIGVTAAEYAAIHATAAAFVSAHTANLLQLKNLHDALNGGPPTGPYRQQITAVKAKDATLIPMYVNQIQAAIGSGRFQLLDQWARTNILPHILSAPR